MNVAVFGAGGRTGRGVVAEALARGHGVTAAVRRPPDPPPDAAVRIVTGDARDPAILVTALEGTDAVLSAMGPVGDAPGADYSDGIAALAAAMEVNGPARLVITSNARILDERPLTGPYAAVSEDHRRALATLRATDLRWTVIDAPMLTDGEPRGAYEAAVDVRGAGHEIDRADFARAVVDALDHEDWIGHLVDVTA